MRRDLLLQAHELARRRGRDEVGDRRTLALVDAVVDALECVDDEIAVEDREDRAAEAHQRVRLAGGGGAVERLAQQLHRSRVVQQDAALDVAHDDALRELGHERGQAASLLFDAVVRFTNLAIDVRLLRGVRLGKPIDRAGDRPHLRCAAGCGAVLRIGHLDDARVLGEMAQRGHVAAPERTHSEEDNHQHQERRHHEARDAVPHYPQQRRPIRLFHVSYGERHGGRDRREQQQPRCRYRQREAGLPPHRHSPSSARTCAIRSDVENGFVTYASAPTAMPLLTSMSRPFADSITIRMPAHAGFSRIFWHTS